MKYLSIVRLLVLGLFVIVILWWLRSGPLIRDAVLWLLLVYFVVGSVFGGVRRLVAEVLTGRKDRMMVSRHGASWATLTLWLLSNVIYCKNGKLFEAPWLAKLEEKYL